MEAAEILKRAKTDANCCETEKNQATVAVANKIESKCDLDPETTVDNGAHVDHIAAVSRTSKANNTKLVKCQNCGIQHPVRTQNLLKCLEENILKRKETSLRKKLNDCRKTTLLKKAFYHCVTSEW